MSKRKVHYLKDFQGLWDKYLCSKKYVFAPCYSTFNKKKVTCRRCLKIMGKGER